MIHLINNVISSLMIMMKILSLCIASFEVYLRVWCVGTSTRYNRCLYD